MLDRPYQGGHRASLDEIGALIGKAHGLIASRMDQALAPYSISYLQWSVLRHVCAGGADRIGDIARHVGMVSGTATRIADQLERKALLRRQRDRVDRRVVRVAATEAGIDIVTSAHPRVVRAWEHVLAPLDAAEAALLRNLALRLMRGLDHSDARQGPAGTGMDASRSIGMLAGEDIRLPGGPVVVGRS